jgi:FSR family fosmidomycin resistance protein-like MFS transporter
MVKDCKKAVNWLIFSHFILDCYPGIIAPILPFIASKINVQMHEAMLIISIANISSYLLQPIFGYFADKCQKRFFIFWGIIIASFFIPLMGYAENFMALTIAIVLGEIGVGFFHPQATSFITKFCSDSEKSKWNMGCFLSMGSIGYGVGAIVATNIYDKFGEHALIYTSFIGILTALFMFVAVPKVTQDFDENKAVPSLFSCMKDIFSNSLEIILILASIVKSIIVSSYTMIMPFYWKSTGLSASKIGYISCLFLASSTLGMLASPKSEKIFGTRNTFYISFFSILPLALLMYYCLTCNSINFAIIIYTIIGFFIFLTQPINVIMSQKILPKYQSLISGVVGGFTWGVVGAILPILSLFAEKVGILNGILFISIIPLISCILVRKIPKQPID